MLLELGLRQTQQVIWRAGSFFLSVCNCPMKLRKSNSLSKRPYLTLFRLTRRLGSLAPQFHHEEHKGIARNAEQSGDADVPPAIVPLVDVDRAQIVRAGRVLAVLARRAVVRVGDIAGIRAEEVRHVFSASASRGQRNRCEFVRLTLDLHIPDDGLEETAEEVGEGV